MVTAENRTQRGIILAILAASLYALSTPCAKLLLDHMPPTLMAGFLYLGAGVGMILIALFRKHEHTELREQKLTRQELPFILGMIVLDIAAPIFLLFGLSGATAANVSLLNNFEIAATAIIALVFFRERISLRLWVGIIFVTLACCILSFDGSSGAGILQSLHFSSGSLFVLLASCCWGLENNCTRMISSKDPLQIVLLKGIFSGTGSIIIGLFLGERLKELWSIIPVLCLGLVAYGLSIYFYVYSQRLLGAAKTSAYYAIAPFIGSLFSLILFRQMPGTLFFSALLFMLIGARLSS